MSPLLISQSDNQSCKSKIIQMLENLLLAFIKADYILIRQEYIHLTLVLVQGETSDLWHWWWLLVSLWIFLGRFWAVWALITRWFTYLAIEAAFNILLNYAKIIKPINADNTSPHMCLLLWLTHVTTLWVSSIISILRHCCCWWWSFICHLIVDSHNNLIFPLRQLHILNSIGFSLFLQFVQLVAIKREHIEYVVFVGF